MRASVTIILLAMLAAAVHAAPAATSPAATTARTEEPPDPKRLSLVGKLPEELTVHKSRTGHLMVSPLINGQQLGSFIFDTGAGMSCIDHQVAQKLALPDAGETIARGAGGSQSTRLRGIESLALGPLLVEGSMVVDLDLRLIGIAIGEPIDGIIGYECFLPAIYEIDLAAPKIVVHDPKTYRLPEGAQWQPLVIRDRRPHAMGQIEDKEPGLFMLDTGATGALAVHSPTVKKLKLLEDRKTTASMTGGVGGLRIVRSGAIESLALCGQKIQNVKTVFSQAEKDTRAGDDVQGEIGVEVLKQFRMIVNYPDRKIALIPRE